MAKESAQVLSGSRVLQELSDLAVLLSHHCPYQQLEVFSGQFVFKQETLFRLYFLIFITYCINIF